MKQSILCIAVFILSCNKHIHPTTAVVNGSPMLLGKISETQLEKAPFSDWFHKEYIAYHPDVSATDSLRSLANSYRYEIFFGTWCGDSKREVPRLLKLLSELHVKPSAITLIAVGNGDTLYKQSPNHEEKGKSIYRVPHLNIYKDGKEVGRVTETPVKSWEKDMLAIITGQQYMPTHAKLLSAAKIIDQQPNATAEELAEPMRALSLPGGQILNGYGYAKLYSNEPRFAYTAFKLNNILFPDAWYTYNALATYYRWQHDDAQEKLWLQQALQKKPDEESVKKRLAVLK
jgi:hypothetical protein